MSKKIGTISITKQEADGLYEILSVAIKACGLERKDITTNCLYFAEKINVAFSDREKKPTNS